MKRTIKKYHAIRCLLLTTVIIVSIILVGCKAVSAEQVVSDVTDAYSQVKTYSAEERLVAVTEIVKDGQAGTTVTSQNATGAFDIVNKQFKANIEQNGQPIQGMQTSTRQYLVNDWLYSKSDILDYEDKDHEVWVKLDLGDGQLNRGDRLWNDNNPLGQQVQLLNTATEVKAIGTERFNGSNCYILDIKPDWQVLTDWLSLRPPWRGPGSFNLPEQAKSLSFHLWVSEDTIAILKSDVEIDYEIVSFDSSYSTVHFKGETNFSDYNEPLEIDLPNEALNAIEGPIS